jgi:DNA-binding MarR family transcriptional regulator
MKLTVRLLTLLDYGHEIEDYRILGRIHAGMNATSIARGLNVSLQSITGHLERLKGLGFCDHSEDRQVVLTAAGRKRVEDLEAELAAIARGLLSEDRLQWSIARDTVERRLETRRLLHKLGRGEEMTIVEALKLEDAGLARRVSLQGVPSVEMTDKGEQMIASGRPGPRPGNGNRHASINTGRQ